MVARNTSLKGRAFSFQVLLCSFIRSALRSIQRSTFKRTAHHIENIRICKQIIVATWEDSCSAAHRAHSLQPGAVWHAHLAVKSAGVVEHGKGRHRVAYDHFGLVKRLAQLIVIKSLGR